MHPPAASADPVAARLVPAMFAWTLLTGLVDAMSFLHLDHVFVANMTGNIVFLGFALGGDVVAPLPTVLLAIAGFLIGAWAGGTLRAHDDRVLLVRRAVGAQLVPVLACLAAALLAAPPPALVAGLLSLAMGMQSAVARRAGIFNLTTTVLTLTVTGLVADRPQRRRVVHGGLSVLMMLLGAACGAFVLHHVGLLGTLGCLLTGLVSTGLLTLRGGAPSDGGEVTSD